MDIGFMELLLISIVALVVLGPEKLPQAVRTAALWIGRARRSFNKVKSDIEREINADEIRRQLHNESILADLDEAKEKAGQFVKESRDSVSSLNREVRRGLDDADSEKAGKAEKKARSETEKAKSETPGSKETGTQPAPEQTGESQSPVVEPGDDATADAPPQDGAEERPQDGPVTDFYNNPPGKIVTVQDGKLGEPAPRNSDQDDTEQDRNDKA